MSNTPTNLEPGSSRHPISGGERLVYVMPEHAFGGGPDDEISLRDLWNTIWRGKWLIIFVTLLFAAGSVAYALHATEWYRAEVLLAPAEEISTPALLGQLGGLAALAGVSVGGGNSAESIAVLRSREFARSFIEDYELLPVFFADKWISEEGRWQGDDPDRFPDIRDAVKYFHDNVLRVSDDRRTLLVTLAVEWKDGETAAIWANALVERLNVKLRDRAIRDAETNVAYLERELNRTNVVTLQETIGRLMETELQKLMLARGNQEFAFKVVDSAQAPRQRVRPKRALIAMAGTMLGGFLSVIAVFLLSAIRGAPSAGENELGA